MGKTLFLPWCDDNFQKNCYGVYWEGKSQEEMIRTTATVVGLY